ncbi:MAG: TIGR03435 family protein [Acidobacteriaceae bacterium]
MTRLPAILLAATFALAAAFAPALHAQLPTLSDVDPGTTTAAPGPLPQWDVALVKPHPPADRNMSWQMTDDGLSLVNLPLQQMLCSAWDLKPYQIEGLNGWMKSTTFDLTAKVSGQDVAAYKKLNTAQRRQMLQQLLTDRFHLKVHLETRTLPTYDLVLDKDASKLKPDNLPNPPSEEEAQAHPDKYSKRSMTMGPGMFEATGVPLRSLASQLSNAVGRPVHDATGLTGNYDINLHYRPDDTGPAMGDTNDAPSIFSAVQTQLGLKLIPSKGPVNILVVDAAQKPEAD